MAKARRTSTPEFQARAVELVAERAKSPAEVARDLDLGERMSRARKRAPAEDGDRAFPGKGNPPAPEEGLRRLRAEGKRLTMGRDILRKRRASSPASRHGVRLRRGSSGSMAGPDDVPGPPRLTRGLLRLAGKAAGPPGGRA